MKRKLHHTVMALLATASVLTALLLVASPVEPSAPAPAFAASSPMVTATSDPTADAVEAIQDNGAVQRRHLRHSRALLALPYFSFAQGLRRTRS